jgi:hypothetical protein
MTTSIHPAPTKADLKRWQSDPERYQNELADYFEFHFEPDRDKTRDVSDLAAIRSAADVVTAAEHALMLAVLSARVHGRTWTEIGARLGVSRQAVHARFGHIDTKNKFTHE